MRNFSSTHRKLRDARTVPDGYTPIEEQNANTLVIEYYDELLRIARAKRRRSGVGETLRTTDLLHESFMKLSGERTWTSHDHFIRSAVLAMRSVIVGLRAPAPR